jgi:hypothetical protein
MALALKVVSASLASLDDDSADTFTPDAEITGSVYVRATRNDPPAKLLHNMASYTNRLWRGNDTSTERLVEVEYDPADIIPPLHWSIAPTALRFRVTALTVTREITTWQGEDLENWIMDAP